MNKIAKLFESKIIKIAAIITALTTITGFAVNIYTQQLRNECNKSKENLKACEDKRYDYEVDVLGTKITVNDMISETCYLRYLQQYYEAVAYHEQTRNEESQERMKQATDALAGYIVTNYQQIIRENKKDNKYFIVLISSNKMRFSSQEYYIPQPVWRQVNDPKKYTIPDGE